MDSLSRPVMLVVLVISLLIWAIVGFIFWIPLLIRSTAIFSASLIHSAVTAQKPANLNHGLEVAASFYFSGFKNTLIAFAGDEKQTSNRKEARVLLLLIETAWTFLAWVLILAFFSPGFSREISLLVINYIRNIFI